MEAGDKHHTKYNIGAEPWSHVPPLPSARVVLGTRARKISLASSFLIIILGMMGRCAHGRLGDRQSAVHVS